MSAYEMWLELQEAEHDRNGTMERITLPGAGRVHTEPDSQIEALRLYRERRRAARKARRALVPEGLEIRRKAQEAAARGVELRERARRHGRAA